MMRYSIYAFKGSHWQLVRQFESENEAIYEFKNLKYIFPNEMYLKDEKLGKIIRRRVK